MRKRSFRSSPVSVGWLFADLLLALAMIFLIANTNITPLKASIRPKPTPSPTATPSPTPIPIPRLELQPHRFTINIDANGYLSNNADAINNAKKQIRSQGFLKGRSVGLVIAYGGAPTTDNIPMALDIAAKTYDVCKSIGKDHFAFENASYYTEKLYRLGDSPNTVTIDVFLFKV
ncbi:hypothetical protein KSC_039570 [Ktedonobacter sp. SOSP1-52]|uniref:hypothetical protein n=1 Tax=Ktedonobacter sp. SOSP1-52 TaxID=2778366 RepID=UPI0019159171|nr:hypothetical protein [Ktedonobacter sp. SOSP1-52]GHO65065.1 hypothetical protein KSC_039570 [Ktedonobacter sp. SOSP1-52]